MKLLVTGGAGFIGSNFIRYWLNKYKTDKIVNLDKLTYAGHLSSTQDFAKNSSFVSGKNYEFIKGDICNAKVVNLVMKKIDVVVNFAAETHVDRSILGPSVFVKTNVMGTQVLLESAFKNNVKRFHHISTDEVFGTLRINEGAKFNELTHYDPRSPYSATKAGSDHLVRSYFHTFGLPVSITNCSNNFGPYQDPEKFLPRMITNLLDGKEVYIYGDGKYVRDWLFVNDHVRAIDMVINKGKSGQTYLVGGNLKDINNIEIAKKTVSYLKKDLKLIKFVKDRPGHDRRYAVDWSKINRDLKWEPEYDFDTWLYKTIDWYRDNEWWWKPLKKKSEKIYKQ